MSENIQFKTGSGAKIYPNPYWPIGSIYLSVNEINPSVYFGGVWEQIAQGRTLVGVDTSQEEFNSVKKIGGEKKHTLTIPEMPGHNHGIGTKQYAGDVMQAESERANAGGIREWATVNNSTGYTGNSQPHNNLQPYFTCFIWLRTA